MDMLSLPLVLASGSPRRKEILSTMGLEYMVDVSDVDEQAEGTPQQMVLTLSERKARSVAARHPQALILAADTLVSIDGAVLGKPQSREHAFDMLKALSGKNHEVYTGLTLIDTASSKVLSCSDCTRVHFVEMSDDEIRAYIASNEPMDKAGAYAIQGIAGMFIDRIEGSYSNVVGLPMALLRAMLKELNCIKN